MKNDETEKVVIVSVPKGTISECIRAAWVGIEFYPVSERILRKELPLDEIEKINKNFFILRIEAIEHLKKFKKIQAVRYWETKTSKYILFEKGCCRVKVIRERTKEICFGSIFRD